MFNEQYIAVANQRASDSNSIIYRYNVTSASFEVVQLITTNGATDWEHFTINWPQALSRGSQLLRPRIRISQHVFNTPHPDQPTRIQYSNATHNFEIKQEFATYGAMGWEYFSIGTQHYLAVANYRSA